MTLRYLESTVQPKEKRITFISQKKQQKNKKTQKNPEQAVHWQDDLSSSSVLTFKVNGYTTMFFFLLFFSKEKLVSNIHRCTLCSIAFADKAVSFAPHPSSTPNQPSGGTELYD